MKHSESTFPKTIKASTLEQIKALELELARRFALAQDEAEQAQQEAALEAAKLKKEIEQTGQADAHARHESILAAAHTQAQAIRERADQDSQQLAQQLSRLSDQAQHYALSLILGRQQE